MVGSSTNMRFGGVLEDNILITEIMGIPKVHVEVPIHGSGNNKYKEIFSSRAIQLMAIFIWVYVGAEVTTGGVLSDSMRI